MEKYTIDFERLDKNLNKANRIKLADVHNRIEKVGFGVVRFMDDRNKTNLWQVVDNEYIVAMYDEPQLEATSSWSIESDKLNKNATIFYKNTPIKSLAFSELGIKESEINTFKTILPERLANNRELVRSMVNSLDGDYKDELLTKYPELK